MGPEFRFCFKGRLVLFSAVFLLLTMPGVYGVVTMDFGNLQGFKLTRIYDFDETYRLTIPSDYHGCLVIVSSQEDYYGGDPDCSAYCDMYVSTSGCSNQDYCEVTADPGDTIDFTFSQDDECYGCSMYYGIKKYRWCGDGEHNSLGSSCVNGEITAEDCNNCPEDVPTPSGGVCCYTGVTWTRYSSSYEDYDCCDDSDCASGETCEGHICTTADTCGNGQCSLIAEGENCQNCPADCPTPTGACCAPDSDNAVSSGYVFSGGMIDSSHVCCSGSSYTGDCCDDDDCSWDETCTNHQCMEEGPACGDGSCESGEDCNTCSSDCSCPSGWCCSPGAQRSDSTTGCIRSGYRIDTSYVCCSGTKYSGDCCDNYGCVSGKVCQNYQCVDGGGGSTPLCGDCDSHSDCASGYCATFASGRKRCTTGTPGSCCEDHWIEGYTEGVDCCGDYSCTGGKVCVNYKCVEGGGKANGESCSSDSECDSRNCRGVCCKAGETCCRYNIDCTESKECDTDNHYCKHTSEQCSPGCRDRELGDGSCDALCDTVACKFDEGDCERRGRCNNDESCETWEGENCKNCLNDCRCASTWCCAPDSSYGDPDSYGCVLSDARIDSNYICCDGGKVSAGWGEKCEDIEEAKKKPYGGSCTKDDDCKSNHCEDGICCTGSYAQGENCCRDHTDCTSDRYCNDYHRCERKFEGGASCSLNVQCKSGKCWNSECYVEPEEMTYGETCQGSYECEEGLACKKGKDTSRMFCCPEGNEWCCSQDTDCAEAVVNDYYCYKGTDPDPSKWFSCQPTTKTIREQEYQAKRLSGELKGRIGEACSGNDDCWTGHCANGFCCSWGTCCSSNDDCPDGGACIPGYQRCVIERPDVEKRTQESFENIIEKRVESKHVKEEKEDILGLEAEFYVSTPSQEGKGVIGKKLTSVLVIGNRGEENLYVKARIEDKISTHMENERYEISIFDPERDKTWLDSVPVINWVVSALKKVGTWLWEKVQELWFKDDEGFYEIWPGNVLAITYEFEPTGEGWYYFEAEMRYYSKIGGEEIFSHNSNTNTFEIKEIKDIITVKFDKRIWVREPDCGVLGLVCN